MKRYVTTARRATPVAAILLSLTVAYALPQAQTAPKAAAKKLLTVDDYTKWRSITGQEISSDGRWVTYVLQLTNVPPAETKPVLHVINLDTSEDVAGRQVAQLDRPRLRRWGGTATGRLRARLRRRRLAWRG